MPRNHFVCLLIAITTAAGAAFAPPSASGNAPELSESVTVQHITLRHAPSATDDAKTAAAFLPGMLKTLQQHFEPAGLDEFVTGFRCEIQLHPAPNDSASESTAMSRTGTIDGTNRTYFAEISLLTPSAHTQEARTHIGEPKDAVYFERLLVHEYAAPVLDRITRSKPAGWRFYDAPRWFIEGYEEYLALTCSNEHSRNVTLAKYKEIVRADPRRVRNAFGLMVRDNYLDGAMLLAFMHDRYGREKVQAILTSPAETFGDAICESLGVNLDSFFAAWQEWLEKEEE